MKTYCATCKQEREAQKVKQITLDNGKPAEEGICSVCGAKLFGLVFPNACQ